MKILRKIGKAVVVAIIATTAHAQTCTISGKIIDSKTEETLPQANVFINNSTIGAVSDLNGKFVLNNVRQPGTYELVVSFIGYTPFKTRLNLSSNEMNIGIVRLAPSETELALIEVKGSKDVEWEKKLKKFKKVFLGDDKAATQCSIVNPWVIDFQNANGKMVATASAPIEIENKALGYKVVFYLSNFMAGSADYLIKGNARFELLKPADEKILLEWEQNRERAYYHSSQHLFKAIIDHRINGEGFNLYTDMLGFENSNTRSQFFKSDLGSTIVSYDTSNMVAAASQKDLYKISLKGKLEVHYRNEKAQSKIYYDIGYPVSWITFAKNFILVNKEGAPINPTDIVISGAMSNDRVANMLPLDYLPMGLLFKMYEHETYSQAMDSFYEKIYVHTDKDYYHPADPIWFKGYVNYGNPAFHDSLSRTVYTELIYGPTKKIILSKVLPLDSGFFFGDFVLPDTLKSSDCYLRAYTNLNRNFGDDKLYSKHIPVLSFAQMPQLIGETEKLQSESLKITPDKPTYHTREKVTLSIRLLDKDENTVAANLSISVTDGSQIVSLSGANIISDFPIREIPKAKDFSWKAEYGIGFSAKIKNEKDKAIKETLNVFQVNPRNFFITDTDGQGVFTLTNLNFYDTSRFSFQTTKGKKQVFREADLLKKEPPLFIHQPSPRSFKIIESPQQRERSNVEAPNDSKLLQEVDINALKPNNPSKERPYGKADYVVTANDINTSYGNLLLTLSGKAPGLIVRRDPSGNWIVYVQRSATSSISNGREATVLVNNTVMGGAPGDVLGQINPKTVESIEVTTRVNSLLGSLGCCGIINVFTKSDLVISDNEENLSFLKVTGYAKPRKFSSPDYSDIKSDAKKDYRSLLYWNPNVTPDGKTDASISFFASDNKGQYRVVVEGVTAQGDPVHGDYIINVN